MDANAILLYRLDEINGQLEELSALRTTLKVGSGPRHLVFHPILPILYCINEHHGSLTVFQITKMTGALTELQTVSLVPADFLGNALASDIHVSPDGLFVYASVRKTNTISADRIDQVTGIITDAGVFNVESNPRGFAIDPSGMFLVCAGQESNHLAVYKIQPNTGVIDLLARYSVGQRPSWIEIIRT